MECFGPDGSNIGEGSAPESIHPVQFFRCMFPQSHLSSIATMTNGCLGRIGRASTSSEEILKFFGVKLLMIRCSFSLRRSLWSTQSKFKHLPSFAFGKIMSRERFETL